MKKTKIICTLGPSSCDKETVAAMADAGMNVARLNFSHGDYAEHAARIAIVKQVREEKHMPISLLLDTNRCKWQHHLEELQHRERHLEHRIRAHP